MYRGKYPDRLEQYFSLLSELRENYDKTIVLKGNILLNKILPESARSTKDMDLDIVATEDEYKTYILPVLTAHVDRLVDSGEADFYTVREIKHGSICGIKVYKYNELEQPSLTFSVDINLISETVGLTLYRTYDYDFYGSSLERILSDKMSAVLSSKRYRRMKDFYDIYILLNSGIEVDLNEFMYLFQRQNQEATLGLINTVPFDEMEIDKLYQAWNKLRLGSFSGEERVKPKFQDVIKTLYKLTDSVCEEIKTLESVLNNEEDWISEGVEETSEEIADVH